MSYEVTVTPQRVVDKLKNYREIKYLDMNVLLVEICFDLYVLQYNLIILSPLLEFFDKAQVATDVPLVLPPVADLSHAIWVITIVLNMLILFFLQIIHLLKAPRKKQTCRKRRKLYFCK